MYLKLKQVKPVLIEYFISIKDLKTPSGNIPISTPYPTAPSSQSPQCPRLNDDTPKDARTMFCAEDAPTSLRGENIKILKAGENGKLPRRGALFPSSVCATVETLHLKRHHVLPVCISK
ncbi:hypothetical protein GWI33_008060 [Rhynchophorus ferrugineus]|uniref:Uncharacterized protein n=1 Tax=Rhynchophorus ferrugineus TaxID=354439 RepID=A0A834ID90_RHYFE|nr:hypothetical protein GWI33_008060 [Rhynchophorus ferrugineus]